MLGVKKFGPEALHGMAPNSDITLPVMLMIHLYCQIVEIYPNCEQQVVSLYLNLYCILTFFRYNISTDDYDPFKTDASRNQNM